MSTSPPADRPTICACPGCEEIVEQPADPGVRRLYHSQKCRQQARRLRRGTPGESLLPSATAQALTGGEAQPLRADQTAALTTALTTGGHSSPDPVQSPARAARPAAPAPASPGGRHRPGPPRAWGPLQHRRSRVALVALVAAGVLAGGGYLTDQLIAPGARHSSAGPQGRPLPPRTATTPTAGRPAAHPARSGSHSSPRQPANQRLVAATGAPVAPAATGAAATVAAAPAASSAPKAPLRTSANSAANSALISYEDGTADGWSPFWGDISATVSTQTAYAGTHFLLLTTTGDRYSAIGTTASIQGLKPGDEVIYHVWSSGQQGGVRPFAQDGDYGIYFGQPADTPLPAKAGWFTLTWTVPSLSGLHAIGMQVTNPGGGQLRLGVDAMSWPGS